MADVHLRSVISRLRRMVVAQGELGRCPMPSFSKLSSIIGMGLGGRDAGLAAWHDGAEFVPAHSAATSIRPRMRFRPRFWCLFARPDRSASASRSAAGSTRWPTASPIGCGPSLTRQSERREELDNFDDLPALPSRPMIWSGAICARCWMRKSIVWRKISFADRALLSARAQHRGSGQAVGMSGENDSVSSIAWPGAAKVPVYTAWAGPVGWLVSHAPIHECVVGCGAGDSC